MCLHFIQIILWAVIQITNQEEIVSLENMTLDKLSAIGKPSILPGPSYAAVTRSTEPLVIPLIQTLGVQSGTSYTNKIVWRFSVICVS